ncbi:2-amino-4-hydroxy-6-hydroxymethyldihydropteridine diphosphokinase [Candidatus Saccharibacteria bacterium]|nr:2-amino-4-hydroxy-6-hydroxymethyldihydropteridine diphosphokinase [Candidatus Saccharibacteria bacterium]
MATVFLALGSNVGDSPALIAGAIEMLESQLQGIVRAPLYTSKAVGYTDQPDFCNTAMRGETDLPPIALLKFVKDIEQEMGRIHRFRWGPREIDIDIIYYGELLLDTPELTIPHPRAHERDFVLQPIADIAPDFIDPRDNCTVQALLDRLSADHTAIQRRLLD